MHVAAANPQGLDANSIDPAVVARERGVLTEKARATGKPDNVIEKIVDSGLKTYFKEVSLVDQPFVHDGSKTVAQAVKEAEKAAGAPIVLKGFVRFALGEGIEKETSDFAAEVAAAVNG
jgi:elongation factor Ts